MESVQTHIASRILGQSGLVCALRLHHEIIARLPIVVANKMTDCWLVRFIQGSPCVSMSVRVCPWVAVCVRVCACFSVWYVCRCASGVSVGVRVCPCGACVSVWVGVCASCGSMSHVYPCVCPCMCLWYLCERSYCMCVVRVCVSVLARVCTVWKCVWVSRHGHGHLTPETFDLFLNRFGASTIDTFVASIFETAEFLGLLTSTNNAKRLIRINLRSAKKETTWKHNTHRNDQQSGSIDPLFINNCWSGMDRSNSVNSFVAQFVHTSTNSSF